MTMQPEFPTETPSPAIEQVLASLRRLRVRTVDVEYSLQSAIAARFDQDEISYAKEYRLASRNRIDFLIPGGIGVEVKKGRPNSGQVMAQIERYCAFDAVRFLVLVVEKHVFEHDQSANGKPVYYVPLHKLWGIAL